MKKNGSKVLGIAVALVLGAVGTVAFAHSTGNERRNDAQCNAIDTTKYPAGEIGWCLTCVHGSCPAAGNPSGKCHYHPGAPGGTRCRPDNGQP